VVSSSHLTVSPRYFFHATPSRIDSEEYDERVEEDEINVDNAEAGPSGFKVEDEEAKIKAEGVDPALADWFKIEDEEKKVIPSGKESDSETENDSDNADVANEESDGDGDDWFKVKATMDTSNSREDQPDVRLILSG
jgi:DNA ligase-4